MSKLPDFKAVPVTDLNVDHGYQRQLKPARARKIATTFDPVLLGALSVSRRADKTLWVFDGQHRLEALKAMGEATAPCLIYAMTATDEARTFVSMQRERRGISALERFTAQLYSGDEGSKALSEAVEAGGSAVGDKPGEVRAVTTLERVARRHGYEALTATISTLVDTWDGDAKYLDGGIVEGMAEFLAGYGHRFGPDERERLADVPPAVVLRKAVGPMGGGGSQMRVLVCRELRRVTGITQGRPRQRWELPALAVAA